MGQNEIKTRTPLLTIVVGKKGVGKSYTTKKLIDRYVAGNPSKGIAGRKALVLDINNEYDYKRIDINDVKKFSVHPKIECRRVVVFNNDGTVKTHDQITSDLSIILTEFRNGLILVEDFSKYVSDSISMDIVGFICTNRHSGQDILVQFQSISKAAHPKLLANTNVLRYHLVEDSVERSKNRFCEKTELLKIAEAIIKNSAEFGQREIRNIKRENQNWQEKPKLVKKIKELENKYIRIFVYCNYDEGNISGDFTKEEFDAGVFRYISENQAETINTRMKKIDSEGHKLYNPKTAIDAARMELTDQYFGN